MNRREIIRKMNLEEKIALCSGADTWHTKKMEVYGIPSIIMADGPHGLRKQLNESDILGINESVPATCFPTAVSMGSSWDANLIYEVGTAIGKEAAENGVSVVLGPGANIKRNPLCGRNFEYFSEDPFLTGELAAAHIRGTQSQGVGASLKHFAANSQEYKRFSSDSMMDERTLREIYLSAFETAVKEGQPAAVMCAYNKLNGEYCSDHKELLTEILRKEWGFDGLVVTDWGAMNDRIKAFQAGCDLCMPGGSAFMEKEALQAVKDGKLSGEEIDRSVERVLKLVERGSKAASSGQVPEKGGRKEKNISPTHVDAEIMEKHDELAYRVAAESAVLLKNQDSLLPLAEEKSVVFIGHMAKELRYQGAGSSHMNPWKLSNVLESCPQVKYVEGCHVDGSTDSHLMEEAVKAAKGVEAAVVFAGLTDQYESEGFDRENMAMPEGHNRLIEAVAAANPNTVVVLLCGSPVEMPWENKVKSILYMGLPGQAGGRAIVDLLFGRANPCGKLAETWPVFYEDCICSSYYAHGKKDAHYREGVYVGYRYYESAGIPVRYPFGYGLSYTKFAYSNLMRQGDRIHCMVKNVGKREGKEIVQFYVEPPKGECYRPVRELKGFCKVSLRPGESKRVTFRLDERDFALWKDGWIVPEGTYRLRIGSSVQDLPLAINIEMKSLNIEGKSLNNIEGKSLDTKGKSLNTGKKDADFHKDVPEWYFSLKGVPTHEDFEMLTGRKIQETRVKKGEFTMSNSVVEMKDDSMLMRLFYKIVELVISSRFGWKKDYSDPTFRMMMNTAVDASFNGMKINVGMKPYIFEGLLEMANGHFLKGIRKMLEKK